MKLVTVSQMKAIEREADSSGLTYAQMMENAGRGLADIVYAVGEENGWDEVVGLVGSGNNGGDTLIRGKSNYPCYLRVDGKGVLHKTENKRRRIGTTLPRRGRRDLPR